MYGVLILSGGADWEPIALTSLGAEHEFKVLRRCVDVAELLSQAATGHANVALIEGQLADLDQAAFDLLRDQAVTPVLVLQPNDAVTNGANNGLNDRWSDGGAGGHLRVNGAQIIQPDDLGQLAQRLRDVLNPDPAPPSIPEATVSNRGRVVAIWGPAGAPGRSTIAITLSGLLAKKRDVTLIDADSVGPALAAMLGVTDETSGILAASRLTAAHQLEALLGYTMRGLGDRLRLVTGLPRPERWAEVRANTVSELIRMSSRYGDVVVDCGYCLEDDPSSELAGRPGRSAMTLEALAQADQIVVVGLPDPVGLIRLSRGVAELLELGYRAELRVVVNRSRESLRWSKRQVGLMLAEVGYHGEVTFLPEDQLPLDQASLNATSPHTSPTSAFVQSLHPVIKQHLLLVGEQ
jgi:MinD-like ATPase involved in chromosome partitioning or flagellar assembly